MINLLFIPCVIISAVKVLEPVPPRTIGSIPADALPTFILVILAPLPVILVAAKVFVSLFHDRLADCRGVFVPLPTTNKLGTNVLAPVPPLATGNTPFVSVDRFIRFAKDDAPVPPLASGNMLFVSVSKLIRLAKDDAPVPPLASGNMLLVSVSKFIRLARDDAPVPPFTIGNIPCIEDADKLISAESELKTMPPFADAFIETVLPLIAIPVPAVISVFVNRLKSMGSVFNVVISCELINPVFLFSTPRLTNI